MRIHPRNLGLLAVLAALVAANVWLERPAREASGGGRLFPELEASRAARIELTVPGQDVLEIVQGEDGWVLPGRRDFPALEYAVTDLLGRVASLSRVDRIGQEASSHGTYGVGEDSRRLRIADDTGTTLAELRQGAPPEGGSGSHVRPLPGDEVFRAADLALLDAHVGQWVDTRLMHLDPSRVRGIAAIEDGELLFDLLRLEDGRWRCIDRKEGTETDHLAPAVVEPLLRAAQSLFFTDVSPRAFHPEMGFSPPWLTLEFDVGEEERKAVWIGDATEGELRFAHDPHREPGWYVTLPETTAVRLREAMRHVDRARK